MVNPLRRLADEMAAANGPVSRSDLAQRIGVERTALDGMLETLQRKQLVLQPFDPSDSTACPTTCNTTCAGLADCPFVVALPRRIVLRSRR